MAYYGSFGEINYSNLSASTTDNAVDIFVYDTRKDSDGGAWRKRSSDLSWYNETLNTATRGSRQEFPAVAVIVSESDKLTIYDGDDPDLPMWMVFNTSSGTMLRSGVITSIKMLNAELWVTHDSGSGVHGINFLKDTAIWLTASSSYGGYYGFVLNSGGTTIAERNTAGGNYYNNISGATNITIASSTAYDVAMTVLPNAPIDSATGLPVPTVAIAGVGGVSIVKDDGTVANITAAAGSSYDPVSKIDITEDYRLIFEQDSEGRSFFCIPIPSSSRTTVTNDGSIIDKVVMKYYSSGAHIPYPTFLGSAVEYGISIGENDNQALVGRLTGDLTILHPNFNDPARGKVAYITSKYNSGWQHGNSRCALLSDTSTTTASSSSIISGNNSTFDTGSGNWAAPYQSTIAVVNGQLEITATASNPYATLYVTGLTIGKEYRVQLQSISSNFSSGLIAYFGNDAGLYRTQYGSINISAAGVKHHYFTATTTNLNIQIAGGGSVGQVGVIDNVYLYELESDRSMNAFGLQVYGSISKTPVATGADLISYTNNNSTNNYLRLPLSTSILNLEGVFSIMYWFRCDGVSSYNGWGISEDDISSQSAYTKTPLNWYVQTSGGAGYMGYRGSNITSPGDVIFASNVWNFIVITRSGSTIKMYLNGVLSASTSGNCFNPSVPYSLRLFNWSYSDAYYGNSDLDLSLFRISQAAPSAEEIKVIYESEKFLFQENSKCTLYGTSDSVTGIAYDDTTKLLHVGTSSGRSDFQGLRRINNTTTAVATAISASNGLIIEQ